MDVTQPQPLELTAFVQLCLSGKVIEEYEIRSPVVSLGRGSDCDIVIDNAAVSGFHAVLSQKDGRLLVEDAASTNGVMASGVKRLSVELKSGESVDIAGKYSIRLVEAPQGVARQVTSAQRLADDTRKATVLVDTTTMARLSHNVRPAYLTLSSEKSNSWIVRMDVPTLSFGGSRSADVRVGGWFAPARIAMIERRDDGFFLVVEPGRQVEVDGRHLVDETRLIEGTRFRILDLSGVFHERSGVPH